MDRDFGDVVCYIIVIELFFIKQTSVVGMWIEAVIATNLVIEILNGYCDDGMNVDAIQNDKQIIDMIIVIKMIIENIMIMEIVV
jgi:hypothetical protein